MIPRLGPLLGLILVLSTAALADAADILAAGSMYGSPAQSIGVCYLFNAGNTAVSISSIKIYDELANEYDDVVSNNCPASLAKHRSCRTVVEVYSGGAISCIALVGNKANLRGSLELRDDAGAVINSKELR